MNTEDIQNALNTHGFPCGGADGILGPNTKAAVKQFQAAYCGPGGWLAIDGIPGPATIAALQWVVANNALVSYFSIPEIACHHCGKAYVTRELLSTMFKLRQRVGPIQVVDAYRCPQHNASVGGAPNSQHVNGNAFDPVKGAITEAEATAVGFNGVGKSGAGLVDHVDIRPGAVIVFGDAGVG